MGVSVWVCLSLWVCVCVCVRGGCGWVDSSTFQTLDSTVWCGSVRAADPASSASLKLFLPHFVVKLLSISYVPSASNTKQVYFHFLQLQHTSHGTVTDVFLEILNMSDSRTLTGGITRNGVFHFAQNL